MGSGQRSGVSLRRSCGRTALPFATPRLRGHPGAAGVVSLSPPPMSGPEWCPQGAGPRPGVTSRSLRRSCARYPASHLSSGDGKLSGHDELGSCDRPLLRFLHAGEITHQLRCKRAPLLGDIAIADMSGAGVPQALGYLSY